MAPTYETKIWEEMIQNEYYHKKKNEDFTLIGLYTWERLVCSYPFLLMSLSDSLSGFDISVILGSWNVLGSVSYLISWSSLCRISIISSLENW